MTHVHGQEGVAVEVRATGHEGHVGVGGHTSTQMFAPMPTHTFVRTRTQMPMGTSTHTSTHAPIYKSLHVSSWMLSAMPSVVLESRADRHKYLEAITI